MNIPERPLQPPHLDQMFAQDEDAAYDELRQKKVDKENGMKLCMDCAWFIVNGARCARASTGTDYVFGHPFQNFAQVERESDLADACGPEAKHFKIIPVAA